jgi:predicted nucleic acid-binding protein
MSLFEDAMAVAVQLPMAERERLARALGLSVHTKGPGKTLPLNQFVSRPDPSKDPNQSAAWRRAETGHAVVDTERLSANDENLSGPAALSGLWQNRFDTEFSSTQDAPLASSLPQGSPVVLHYDVCFALGAGTENAQQFFTQPPVEIRLATATYLAILGAAQSEGELARLSRFVQPYAVLSLGPMASSRAVELMLAHATDGLQPLDALIAATALAHEIPVVALNTAPFQNVRELQVLRPF